MIRLAVLDVNETLFPLDAIADRLAEVGLASQLDVWFARVLRDGIAAGAAGSFAAFADLASHHLDVLAHEHGQPPDADRAAYVVAGFHEVTAHPDVEPGLRRLREAGVTVATMTNGSVAITRDFLARAGLDTLVDATYDVAMAGCWKPAPQAYRYAVDRHALAPGQAALLAVHPWDVQGAVRAGLVGAWINRAGTSYPAAFAAPTVQATTFADAVEALR